MLVKQKVLLHFSQWKWVCRSLTSQEQLSLHTAYLKEPVPVIYTVYQMMGEE